MRDPIILLVHLIATLARLMGPGGLRSVVAESVLVKQQLLILNRSRHRAPNLCASDRILAGVCALFMRPARVIRSAIVLRPSTILEFHRALRTRKYRWLFSPTRRRTGPQGPSKALVDAIVDMKRRNPRWGCPRIAQQIALAFAVDIDKDVVRRVLATHYRPAPHSGGPSWLTFLGHAKDSLWSIDLFRCESAILRSHWVLVVMDQYTRRIVGFGIQAGTVDGRALCRMFNHAIRGLSRPTRLSSDHDPLYRFHQWRANLRVLQVTEVKSVPYVPLSHPFVERLIGTLRRECVDQLLFWSASDLEDKLVAFQDFYNAHRAHASLDGRTPVPIRKDVARSRVMHQGSTNASGRAGRAEGGDSSAPCAAGRRGGSVANGPGIRECGPAEPARGRPDADRCGDPPVCAESGTARRRRHHAGHEQACGQSTRCRADSGAAGCVAGDAARRAGPGGLLIDGVHVGGHCIVVALGIDTMGAKHPLGLWEGATENATVCQGLLTNLGSRGLRTDRSLLVIVDGAKALDTAVTQTVGRTALGQRCQVHKGRNILEHLPEAPRPWVKAVLTRAYTNSHVKTAKRLLQDLARRLDTDYPSAATSVREGLDETLTVLGVGLSERLQRSLATTNAIESLLSRTRHVQRHVKRWRGGTMLHESSRARTMPPDTILTCRCDMTLVGRGRSSDSGSHSRGRPHSPAQLDSGREGHRR